MSYSNEYKKLFIPITMRKFNEFVDTETNAIFEGFITQGSDCKYIYITNAPKDFKYKSLYAHDFRQIPNEAGPPRYLDEGEYFELLDKYNLR